MRPPLAPIFGMRHGSVLLSSIVMIKPPLACCLYDTYEEKFLENIFNHEAQVNTDDGRDPQKFIVLTQSAKPMAILFPRFAVALT